MYHRSNSTNVTGVRTHIYERTKICFIINVRTDQIVQMSPVYEQAYTFTQRYVRTN